MNEQAKSNREWLAAKLREKGMEREVYIAGVRKLMDMSPDWRDLEFFSLIRFNKATGAL